MRTTRPVCLAAAAALAVWVVGVGSAAAAVTHTVRRGETLTSIASVDGLSIAELAAANGLTPTAELIAGSSLVIPPQSASPVAAPPAAGPASGAGPVIASGDGGYLVQPGDTLSGIAVRYGTTPAALAAANSMAVNGLLLAGRTLDVSAGPSVESPTESPTGGPSESPTESPTAAVTPTDESVSATDIGAIAQSGGVPPALAEAVAYQESGFNNAMVSRTGATGVMQIEPSTWVDLTRLDGLHLSGDSAADNVRGGVAILQGLLAQTGGDQAEAAAAYYQGLASLRAYGMYPSTQRYVRDVLALEGRFGG